MAPADYVREQAVEEEMMAEAPMMAPEPGALPAEDNATGDEQDAPDMLQMTEDAVERSEGFFGEAGVPPESTPACCDKTAKSATPSEVVVEPVLPDSETQVEIEPAPEEIEPPRGILAWPVWRIGLRVGEILFGVAALVLASFMLWARRK
jgi:hypothetical protein